MDIKKELTGSKIIMVIFPSGDYGEIALENAKALAKGNNVCYFTINKTFGAMKELFNAKGIDMKGIVFVDAISRAFMPIGPLQTAGCYFVSSPGALTELSMAAERFLRHKFNYLVFDSLEGILSYQKTTPAAAAKFISGIASQVKQSKTQAVIYAIDSENHRKALRKAAMSMDKVIDLSNNVMKAKTEGKAKQK